MQIVRGSFYSDLSEKNYIRNYPILAPRGIIYDRNGRQLVFNVPSFDLIVDWQDLPHEQERRNDVIEKVGAILRIPAEQIFEQLEQIDPKKHQSFLVVSNLEHEEILLLEAQLPNLPGFKIEKNTIRQYLLGSYFSHVIGYMGKLESRDIEKNADYFMIEQIGKEGLEFSYEKIMHGKPGERLVEINSLGEEQNLLSETKPQEGGNLVLTIDSDLQRSLYDSLNGALSRLKLKKASAVAIDPENGGILALVNIPSFDNNLFAKGISLDEYDKLKDDLLKPFLNRAVAGQYASGSTIKPLIGAAALQENIITPKTKINDFSGELALQNQYNPEILYHYPDWKAHGVVDIYSAIAQSCNVFFYTVSGGYGNIKGLGLGRLTAYLRLFGLGSTLGIDLPGEASGLVPDEAWKEKAKNEAWYAGDTYHLAIGQGDLLVTPLQMAASTAAIANGGYLYTPRLVDKIIDSDKNIIETIEPNILRENFISKENLDVIKKAMRQTVTAGSALILNSLDLQVAAKTGTAQVAGQKNTNAWATVFAPYPEPKIVLAILIEEGGEGSTVVIPVAKEVLEKYFK